MDVEKWVSYSLCGSQSHLYLVLHYYVLQVKYTDKLIPFLIGISKEWERDLEIILFILRDHTYIIHNSSLVLKVPLTIKPL